MKIIKIALLSIFAFAISVPASGQTFRSLLRKANTQYDLHAYNLAIGTYQQALEKKSDNVEAKSKLADCYRLLNQMEEAASIFADVCRNKDVDKVYILMYGHVLKALGKYDVAKQWYLLYARDEDSVIGNHFAQSCDFAQTQLGVTSSYTTTNEFINTSASEFGATFYGEQQVIYSSARTDIYRSSSSWTGKANNQLFIANISANGYLESPVFLKNNETNAYNEGPLSFSPNGKKVAFTKNNFVDGTRQVPATGLELSIYTADISTNGNWTNEASFPFNGSGYSTGYPAFSPDGNAIYFASDRPDGFGGFDIYVSFKSADSWSAPQNLGPVVNSPGDEISPYFDGNMLYFSSDWHHGIGGMDVFRAEETAGRWTKIFHLGNAINSAYDDYGFIYDTFRNVGYLTSNRLNGRGNEDIYRVNRSADYIVIRITNAVDGSPVPNALVDFSNCGERAYRADERGIYSFQAVQGLACNLIIKKDGYQSTTLQISTLGTNTNRSYDVSMSRVGEAYAGKVIDYTTNQPVQGVFVSSTNQTTGSTAQVQSDATGNYYLSLSPYSTYVLRFSKQTYQDLNVTVRTEDGFDRSILGVISFLPASAGTGDNPYVDTPPDGPVKPVETIEKGYAVQVAAIKTSEIDIYDELNDIGTVYAKEIDGLFKVRVGTFATREEAVAAQKIIKKRGYKGPFIVTEDGVKGIKGIEDDFDTPDYGDAMGRYKVQLAAYTNTKWFDDSEVKDLGVIEERRKGKYKVKYIAGFDSLSEAKSALRKAVAAGFKSAFVVEDVNGELKKVK
jgi:tetratricopeptide (TPR) repeat protein